MFNRILVPLDGTPLAEVALDAATLLARRYDAEVVALRVASDLATEKAVFKNGPSSDDVETYLSQVAHWLREEGDIAYSVLRFDTPAEGIANQVALDQVDLIVMTTHGRKGLDALLHPSVTWEVFRRTTAPVLACKSEEGTDPDCPSVQLPAFMTDPLVPIMVPLDGSVEAESALPLAQQIALTFGNPLVLIRVVEQQPFAPMGLTPAPVPVGALERASEEAQEYLEHKRLELIQAGLRVEIVNILGPAAHMLERYAREHRVELVVIASHGRGLMGQLALGSVARHLLVHLPGPVLLVRRPTAPAKSEPGEALAQTPASVN